MLLTKKTAPANSASRQGERESSAFIHSLRRGLSGALPTMDRRAFLRRSGLGVGVGLAAGQLTLMRKAEAAGDARPAAIGALYVVNGAAPCRAVVQQRRGANHRCSSQGVTPLQTPARQHRASDHREPSLHRSNIDWIDSLSRRHCFRHIASPDRLGPRETQRLTSRLSPNRSSNWFAEVGAQSVPITKLPTPKWTVGQLPNGSARP